MAGSYRHVTRADGRLRETNEGTFGGMIDNLGDAYEAIEEMYDMIQYLSGGSRERIAEAWAQGHLRTNQRRHPLYAHPSDEEIARWQATYWDREDDEDD